MESAVILGIKANTKFQMFAVMAFFFIHDILYDMRYPSLQQNLTLPDEVSATVSEILLIQF